MYKSFNFERLIMARRVLLVGVALILMGATVASATNVQLNLTTSNPNAVSGTWTVSATLSDLQSMGIASFNIDMDGTSGANSAVVQKASSSAATNATSNPPYALFRTTGTASSPNLTAIGASQDTISASNNNDPTVLRFGDGNTSDVTSSVYGDIPGGGALTLATGRWTTTGQGGFIQAAVTSGGLFNLFPLNYAVDDGTGQNNPPPQGTTISTVAAGSVISSAQVHVGVVPEPASLVLLGLGGLGLALARRRS